MHPFLYCLFVEHAEASMARFSRVQFRGDTQLRYRAYARDHGMTSEEIRAHDKRCCPSTLLLPYMSWLSRKWFEWGQVNPGRTIHGAKENVNFDRWLELLVPGLDAVTCECHVNLDYRRCCR
jgi:hypothetical protein